ncbi:MAG TPA: DUF1801 domain-containing protein [Candidatus Limnocylindrales bacterium]
MATSTSVDDYLAALPDDRRGAIEELRRTIRDAAPEATESIAYDMPAFRMTGRFLVSYAAFKHYLSLFPANDAVFEALGDELAPYLAGKGTIRFATDAPIPTGLVTRIAKVRSAEITAIAEKG